MITDRLPGRNIFIEDQEFLYFSGTSYLGIGRQPLFELALREGMNRYGTGFSASRLNNLQLDIYAKAEAHLAEWTGAEAAVTVSSGMLAGQLAAKYLSGRSFLYAPGAHPAIWSEPPTKNTAAYLNFNDWANGLNNLIPQGKSVAIAFNAVDPLYCEPYYFDWISALPDDSDVVLFADDSHGLGITGEAGSGIFRALREKIANRPNIKLIVVGSLAKALGIPGGAIFSDRETIQGIVKSPFFGGATPVIPAYLYALLQTTSLYETARRSLQKNIRHFSDGLGINPGFTYLDNYPVFYTANNALYDRLLEKGVFISHFPYPTPSSKPISRIIISALHTPFDIAKLLEILN